MQDNTRPDVCSLDPSPGRSVGGRAQERCFGIGGNLRCFCSAGKPPVQRPRGCRALRTTLVAHTACGGPVANTGLELRATKIQRNTQIQIQCITHPHTATGAKKQGVNMHDRKTHKGHAHTRERMKTLESQVDRIILGRFFLGKLSVQHTFACLRKTSSSFL